MSYSPAPPTNICARLELYREEPTFREQVDLCSELLKPRLERELRDVLYPTEEGADEAAWELKQTAITQPALFVVEYALAKLWMEWGVHPQAMIGHSVGEYVAACLAGVFSLKDALALLTIRGRLLQQLPVGAMLAVALPEQEVRRLIPKRLSVAAINGPSRCVVSGPTNAVDKLEKRLAKTGVQCRRLHTSHAFHSEMIAPILEEFTEALKKVNLSPPQVPYLSNVTGTWITPAEATNPNYWASHLRQTVRFADGVQHLLKEPNQILLEVGPGRTLGTLTMQHPDKTAVHTVLSSLPSPQESHLLNTLGKLWLSGVAVNWDGFYCHEQRRRIPLPTYPFERWRYWVDAPLPMMPAAAPMQMEATNTIAAVDAGSPVAVAKTGGEAVQRAASPDKKPDVADWFYIPSWKRSIAPTGQPDSIPDSVCWLLFIDACGLGTQLAKRLEDGGQEVITVEPGSAFGKLTDRAYRLNPRQRDDYDALLNELRTLDKPPKTVVHLWSVTPNDHATSEASRESIPLQRAARAQDLGFYSLIHLAQRLSRFSEIPGNGAGGGEIQIAVVSNNVQDATGEEVLCPEKATVLGPVRTIPQEYPNISCRSIDLVLPEADTRIERQVVDGLLAELTAKSGGTAPTDQVIAYRGNHRLVQTFEPVPLESATASTPRLREGGVYLITGGLGGIGLVLAEHLARTVRAKLVLTGRSALPARDEWTEWLANHSESDQTSHKVRKLQELETLGAEVLVLRADVADLVQMQAAIAQALKRFGEINGVIHAAGVPGGGVIQRKTPEEAERILAPKVKGTLVLDAILKDMSLDFFVLCSSLVSIQGIFGQVDYAAANAFLDAFAHDKTSRDGTFTLSINWDTWQEVGMAAKAAKGFDKSSRPPLHPLVDQCIVDTPTREVYLSNFSMNRHWVLNEHRVTGKAVLPGTAYLEMARAALESHAANGTVEIQELYFLSPLTVGQNEEKAVHTILEKRDDGFEFSIMSQSRPSDKWGEHASGKIASIEAEPPRADQDSRELAKHKLSAIEARCNAQEMILTGEEPKSEGEPITFGPRWNNLKRIRFGKNEGLAHLELPEAFAGDLDLYKLHPALLDTATAFLVAEVARDGDVYLPFSYKRLRLKGNLSRQVFSHVSHVRYIENNRPQREILQFNITIMDDAGIELIEIEEYTLKRVDLHQSEQQSVVASARAKTSQGRRKRSAPLAESENFSLAISSPGDLDTLIFQPTARQKPGPGEVEIEIAAAGLNFKDVLLALGVLPSLPDTPLTPGLECAGKIVALGEGVDGFKIGDEVIAFASSCFSAFTATPAALVVPKPDHLSPEEAATIPVAFMTAYYALVELGRLRRAERVLIHAAAGGVGMAAVKIAQWLGAEIFATAGNPEKRRLLGSLGIEHVMDSRSLAFADRVMERTDGRGVDVVLNSLAGEFIPKGLSILAPYGRFLEIGVRDIYSNSQLGLRAFEKGISFFAIMVTPDIPRFRSIWEDVVQHFRAKDFSPLPHRVFPMMEITRAFEHMAQAKHIGKIVVSLQDRAALKTLVVSGDRKVMAQSEKAGVVSSLSSADSSVSSGSQAESAEFGSAPQSSFRGGGLLSSEGVDVFNRILGSTLPQVVVSTQDLEVRAELVNALTAQHAREGADEINLPQAIHPRPELSTTYVPPTNETEQTLADIWGKLLGIQRIGIHDSFFELGGDSLLAVQLNSRLRETFRVDFSVHNFFDAPTIAQMAEFIQTAKQMGQEDTEKIELKLEMIEKLSEDQVKRLLAEMKD